MARPTEAALVVPEGKDITIDLNGYSINRYLSAAAADGHVIRVEGKLTLTDSGESDDVGAITGGKTSGNGGGVYVAQGGTFTLERGAIRNNSTASSNGDYRGGGVAVDHSIFFMTGGAITANEAVEAGGVYGEDSGFTMTGGSITENSASVAGGGVQMIGEPSTIKMVRNPVVMGNKADNKTSNIVLQKDQVIDFFDTLNDDALIGVTLDEPRVFTQGLNGSGSIASFRSDDGALFVTSTDDGEFSLTEQITICDPDFILPGAVTEIKANAFEGADMNFVYIHDDCTYIGNYAFKDCDRLIQIRVPGSCQIQPEAFDGCDRVYIISKMKSSVWTFCSGHDNCIFVEEPAATDNP